MPAIPAIPDRNADISPHRQQIVRAAIDCFEKFGPRKTTIDDVAATAGLARRTVYRVFANKIALLEAVAVSRLDDYAERVKKKVARCGTLRESVVVGSQEVIRLARADRIFMDVVLAASDGELMQYFVDPASPIFRHSQTIWIESLERARRNGELRPHLADADVENWLRGVHLLLFLRPDLKAAGQKALIEMFVLPALLTQG